MEKSELRTKTVKLEGPGSYEIACEEEPEDEWIEIAVPSSLR